MTKKEKVVEWLYENAVDNRGKGAIQDTGIYLYENDLPHIKYFNIGFNMETGYWGLRIWFESMNSNFYGIAIDRGDVEYWVERMMELSDKKPII